MMIRNVGRLSKKYEYVSISIAELVLFRAEPNNDMQRGQVFLIVLLVLGSGGRCYDCYFTAEINPSIRGSRSDRSYRFIKIGQRC